MNTECPVWCDGSGCANDQRHISSTLAEQVVLSTDEPVRLGPAEFSPELVIYLDRHVEEVDPRVVIDQLPAERMKVYLLPTEARRVGEALIRFAGIATGLSMNDGNLDMSKKRRST